MNILIVDDNANNRMILKLLLEDYSEDNKVKFHIDEAKNGAEAVKINGDKKIDLILMDIMMPEMDGIEATRLIRSTHSDVMIIAVSAVDDLEKQKEILSKGAEDYISKPVNSDIFISRMSNYITLVGARSHERKNEFFVNLFTQKIFSRNTKFMIHSEDSLSEFWEFFLLNAEDKYDGLSDVVRTIFSIADTQVRLSIDSGVYVEESEDKQYFTLTNIDKLPAKIVELILKKNPTSAKHKLEDSKISFELEKMCSAEEVEVNVENSAESNQAIAPSVDLQGHKSKDLIVFDYLDSEDLYDLEEYSSKLNSLMLIAGSGDITAEEVSEMCEYLNKIASVLATYSEVYPISNALSALAIDLSTHVDEFIMNAEALGGMCKAFSNDMSSWVQMSFHTGAPSIDFMNDTISVNCQTIASMLTMNDAGASDEEFDDIFDF